MIKKPEICIKPWGKELTEIFNQIKADIDKLSEVDKDEAKFTQNQEGEEATYLGYCVKMSDVQDRIRINSLSSGVEESKGDQTIKQDNKIKHLRIFALSEVVLDTDLIMPGCNVTILAPTWDIQGNFTIDLKGEDGEAYPDQEATSKDGKPGLPGRPGGHFLGIGEKFINPKNLTINVDGGKGGTGQKGSDGANGEDLTREITANIDSFDPSTCPTSKGGDAGAGGSGGLGGKPGTCKIIGLNTRVKIKSSSAEGDNGPDGDNGAVGEGGTITLNVTNLSVKPPKKSKFLPLSIFPPKKQSSQSKQSEPQTSKGFSGNMPHEKNSKDQEQPDSLNESNLRLSLLDYEMLLGQKSEMAHKLSKSFCQKFKHHPEVTSKENAEGFIDELLRLETHIPNISQTKVKFDFQPFYYVIYQRIKDYADSNVLDDQEIKKLKYLRAFTLSRIAQLDAYSKSRIVVDKKAFVERINKNFEELKNEDKSQKIQKHVEDIDKKIDQAKPFVEDLIKDIEDSGKKLNEQNKKYLEEIEKNIQASRDGKEELEKKAQELQNIIVKTTLLEILKIFLSLVPLLPKYQSNKDNGSAIVGVINACINLINKSNLNDVQKLINKLDQLNTVWGKPSTCIQSERQEIREDKELLQQTSKDKIKKLVEAVKPAIEAVQDLFAKEQKYKLDETKIAILKAQTLVKDLLEHKQETMSSFSARLEEMTNQIKDIVLENKEIIELEGDKKKVKDLFRAIKVELSQMVRESSIKDGFINIIDKMIEATETSIRIHEHIQGYKEHSAFVECITDITPEDRQTFSADPKLKTLEGIKQCNLMLEQYYSLVSLTKSLYFPFFSQFIEEFDISPKPKNFDVSKTFNILDFSKEVTSETQRLITKIDESDTFVIKDRDNVSKTTKFTNQPFFTWSYADYSNEITDLLKGKKVFLNADVNKFHPKKAAIKFMEIRIELYQEQKQVSLENYEIELQHSGNSYYRYGNNTYAINHDTLSLIFTSDLHSTNDTFKKIHKLSKDNPMFSPYTLWSVKLTKKDEDTKPFHSSDFDEKSTLYNKFEKDISGFEIRLVGEGKYVDEPRPSIKLEQLDSYYDKTLSLTTQFALEEQINQISFMRPNAFNQRQNPDYWYQAEDITTIQYELMKEYKEDFIILDPINRSSLETLKNKISHLDNKPILCIYDIGDLDWATLAILKDKDDNKIALHKALYGNKIAKLLDELDITKFLCSSTNQQQDNDQACGILALKNMEIIAEQIKSNKEAFIEGFERFEGFVQDINDIREEFGKIYVVGKCEEIKKELPQYNFLPIVEFSELLDALSIADEDTTSRKLAEKIHNYNNYDPRKLYKAALNGDPNAIQLLIDKDINLNITDNLGRTLLHWAVLQSNAEAMKLLIKNGATPHAKDKSGEVPLHLAAERGNVEAMQILLEEQANVQAMTKDKKTPLHLAAKNGHPEAISLLIDKKANLKAVDEDKNTPLHLAAEQGHKEAMLLLLTKNADIEAKNEHDWTPLHLSAKNGHLEAVQLLLTKGAKIEVTDKNECTPLHWAVRHGYQDIIQALLDGGANVGATTKEDSNTLFYTRVKNNVPTTIEFIAISKSTPLHCAAFYGHPETIPLLLGARANIEATDKDERTPLHLAAAKGHSYIVRLLLDAHADIEATTKDGNTPLHLATYQGHKEVMQILIDEGANIEAITVNALSPLHLAAVGGYTEATKLLLSKGANVNTVTQHTETALHFAAFKGHHRVIQLLLEKDADVEAITADGATPLLLAADKGYPEAIKLLLDEGANTEAKTKYGLTPLLLAVSQNYCEVVELLLNKDANTEAVNEDGLTSLHLAAAIGCSETIKLLLSAGAKIEAIDKNANTPLHLAVFNQHDDAVQLLLRKGGANIEATAKKGITPLHLAAQKGYDNIVQLLLSERANIEATDEDERTPLHWAVYNDHKEVVELLLDKGANIEATTKGEGTSLHWAADQGRCEIIQLLLSRGANIEATTENGKTPLHLAVKSGYAKAVQLLLTKGAETEVTDSNENTPLDLAKESGHQEIIQLLVGAGAKTDVAETKYKGRHAVAALLQEDANKATRKEALQLLEENLYNSELPDEEKPHFLRLLESSIPYLKREKDNLIKAAGANNPNLDISTKPEDLRHLPFGGVKNKQPRRKQRGIELEQR